MCTHLRQVPYVQFWLWTIVRLSASFNTRYFFYYLIQAYDGLLWYIDFTTGILTTDMARYWFIFDFWPTTGLFLIATDLVLDLQFVFYFLRFYRLLYVCCVGYSCKNQECFLFIYSYMWSTYCRLSVIIVLSQYILTFSFFIFQVHI